MAFWLRRDSRPCERDRRRLFDRAAIEKTKLIGYHRPYPGVGFAQRRDGSYRFVPA
jgi:hypothetical protein